MGRTCNKSVAVYSTTYPSLHEYSTVVLEEAHNTMLLCHGQERELINRGEAIKLGAAGFLATCAGIFVGTAQAEVPESLPSCPAEGNCVSSTSFKLVSEHHKELIPKGCEI